MKDVSGETFKLSEAPRFRLERGSAHLLEAVLQVIIGFLVKNKLISLFIKVFEQEHFVMNRAPNEVGD